MSNPEPTIPVSKLAAVLASTDTEGELGDLIDSVGWGRWMFSFDEEIRADEFLIQVLPHFAELVLDCQTHEVHSVGEFIMRLHKALGDALDQGHF